ncbi:MAG: tyrosine-type recombinase/integrase [Chloroflexota bacterium]
MTKAYLDPEDIDRIEENTLGWSPALRRYVPILMYRLLIRLLYRTGCRVSEALALEVKDVDLQQGTITIKHLKARLRLYCPECETRLGRTHRYCPGCGAHVERAVERALERQRVRTLPVDRSTLDMLKEYIERGGPVERNGKLLLFGIQRRQAHKIVRDAAARAGIGKLVNPETGREHWVSPHRLRDAHAIRAIKVDDSTDGVRMLQEQLGHASIATTMKYRKVAGAELREWYERIWKE